MPTHLNLRYQEVEDAMKGAKSLQILAEQYGIPDIFSDNGGKVLQLVVATGLDVVPGRNGADATDRLGNSYEIKTLDLDRKAKGFSTNHHLNHATLSRYRKRRFVFALYTGIVLQEAYLVMASDLEPVFETWEKALKQKDHINNPKIPVKLVREIGTVMYLKDVAPDWAVGSSV